jgi:hypothetical protein
MSCPGKGCRNGRGDSVACPTCYQRLHWKIRERLEKLARTEPGSGRYMTLVGAIVRWLREELEPQAAA